MWKGIVLAKHIHHIHIQRPVQPVNVSKYFKEKELQPWYRGIIVFMSLATTMRQLKSR